MSRNKEKDKKKDKKQSGKGKKIISVIILVICIIAMVYSGIEIYKWWDENRKNNEIIEEISEFVTVEESTDNNEKTFNVDFKALRSKNPDTVGWIKVENSKVEYPVVKTSDNDFYLNHSFDKSYNGAGWIFMDYRNQGDGLDKNMIIYGHNRKDKSMFGSLTNILNSDWYNNENNKYITFVNQLGNTKYEVFSVYKIEDEDYYITTYFNNDAEYESFIKKIKSRSVKDFGVEITVVDNILTLSTCDNSGNYRIVLHAKKL